MGNKELSQLWKWAEQNPVIFPDDISSPLFAIIHCQIELSFTTKSSENGLRMSYALIFRIRPA